MQTFRVSIPSPLKVDTKTAKRVRLFNDALTNIATAETELDRLTEQVRDPNLQGGRVIELADQLKATRLDALRAKLRLAVEGKALLADLLAIAKSGEQAAQNNLDQVTRDAGARLEAAGWVPHNRPDLKAKAPEAYRRVLLEQGSVTPEATAAKAPIGELRSFIGWLTDISREIGKTITVTDTAVASHLSSIMR
jgi:hypothetical protein